MRFDQSLGTSSWFRRKVLSSRTYAEQVYDALCNIHYCSLNDPSNVWSCSWRYAAHFVGSLRNHENYMEFYCSGNEGTISEEVESDFLALGWRQIDREDQKMAENYNPDWQFANDNNHKDCISLKKARKPGTFRIALVGNAGSGKDTVSDIISSQYEDTFSVAFADELKRMCSEMINNIARSYEIPNIWFSTYATKLYSQDESKDLLRPLWQWFGTDLVRNKFPNYWINRLAVRINSNSYAQNIVITDCRFENEAEWARENGFFIAKLTGRFRNAPDHDSERHVQHIRADLEYTNVGTVDDLRKWVTEVLIPSAQARPA